jgi:hypothetical protein
MSKDLIFKLQLHVTPKPEGRELFDLFEWFYVLVHHNTDGYSIEN